MVDGRIQRQRPVGRNKFKSSFVLDGLLNVVKALPKIANTKGGAECGAVVGEDGEVRVDAIEDTTSVGNGFFIQFADKWKGR